MNSSVSLENSEINNALKQLYNSKLKEIFAEISCEYGISIDKLYEKYLIENLETDSVNLNTNKKKKRKKIKHLNQISCAWREKLMESSVPTKKGLQ